jgi:DNA polymerase-3 subunit beta
MHIEIEKELLSKNLLLMQSIVEKKKTLPILANVLIDAESENLNLIATDLEISIQIKLSAEIIKPGITTLPAKKLFEIVREMPGNKISIETGENDWIKIKSASSQFNLAAIDPVEFPSVKQEKGETIRSYDPKLLKNIIDKTINSISSDEKKFNLNGLYIHTEQKMLHYVATDGHRLVCLKEPFEYENSRLNEGIIIPKKGLLEIKKICENTDKNLELQLVNGKIVFDIENITLSIRLIDATFPNYRRVIPDKTDSKASINTQYLYDAVKRVSIISEEKNRTVNLCLTDNNLKISAKNEYGNATENMEVNYGFEEKESKFKANYLMDILNSVDSEKIELFLHAGGKPSLIVPEQNDSYCAVLMPISV